MTEEVKQQLVELERRQRTLMFLFEQQKKKSAELDEQLQHERQLVRQAADEIRSLNDKYASLLTVRAASVMYGDVKNARKQLLNMVREIDKCIALLNG
ncbi:MAG: hypothetical protein LBR50_06500 [Tannerella sp.]|jgi:hypothetical protein|nr:hypothetical protein [Tannerella sp.]